MIHRPNNQGRPSPLTDAQHYEAAAIYIAGWSMDYMANLYGCTPPAVRTALVNVGVNLQAKRPRRADRVWPSLSSGLRPRHTRRMA